MPAWVLEGGVLDMLWVDVCAVVSMTVICSLIGHGIMDGVKINPVCGINDSRATQSRWSSLNKADSTSIPACLGRASSAASSDDRELAVGVLADWLPYRGKMGQVPSWPIPSTGTPRPVLA